VTGLSQRHLPDNTKLSQEPDIRVPGGIEPTISASEQPQTYTLNCMATGIGLSGMYQKQNTV